MQVDIVFATGILELFYCPLVCLCWDKTDSNPTQLSESHKNIESSQHRQKKSIQVDHNIFQITLHKM